MRTALNRHTLRALDKADRCLRRSTQIPMELLRSLNGVLPGKLKRLAAEHGKEITPTGYVRPIANPDGPALANPDLR